MAAIRRAVQWIQNRYKTDYPLLHPGLATDGLSLLVEEIGHLVNASEQGQAEMRQIIDVYLRRIARDPSGKPQLFYPFTRDVRESFVADLPRHIVIDPAVAYGRPVIAGTRIPAAVIAERFAAGDAPEMLAADYDIRLEDVHEAIRIRHDRIAA